MRYFFGHTSVKGTTLIGEQRVPGSDRLLYLLHGEVGEPCRIVIDHLGHYGYESDLIVSEEDIELIERMLNP